MLTPKSGLPNVLILHHGQSPDYMADMVSHYFYTLDQDHISLFTNVHPFYIFDDYPKSKDLYGRGFTIYTKLDHHMRKNIVILSPKEIIEAIANKHFKQIIWTSVRRFNKYLDYAFSAGYRKDELIVIDGEDDQGVLQFFSDIDLLSSTRYLKRELEKTTYRLGVEPISFKFPSTHPLVIQQPLAKTQILAPCDPRFTKSYTFTDEISYYQSYQKSLFAITTKKRGWDCLRHYEILACNCLPIFPGIEDLPYSTMVEWDRNLQRKANNLWREISLTSQTDINYIMPFWESLMNRFRVDFLDKMLTTNYNDFLRI